jgi:sucrose phosphorylase
MILTPVLVGSIVVQVRRARNLPLLRPTPLSNGESANVWVTYHNDLVDVDWCNPRVCWEFVNILLDSILHGFSGVRLDAFAYVWKAVNT